MFFITVKHLDTMESLVPNESAIDNLKWARRSFDQMCNSYNAYDYHVIR